MAENEKTPRLQSGGLDGSKRSDALLLPCSIDIYPRGVKTHGLNPRSGMGLPLHAGGERGDISGWSSASRRRFRDWLLTHEPNGLVFGVTLTIPGTPISPEVWHSLHHALSLAVNRSRMGLVWRLEMQKRGQPHIHCIATFPTSKAFARMCGNHAPRDASESLSLLRLWWWWYLWRPILDALPKSIGRVEAENSIVDVLEPIERSFLLGADKHAVDVQPDDGSGLWWRYLCDHSTKLKEAQVCGWDGVRHWGIIGRSFFSDVPPDTFQVEAAVFARVYRWIRQSTRRRLKCPCIFGSKAGVSPRRSSAGASVWFGVSSSIIERLLALSSSLEDERQKAGAGSALDPVKALRRSLNSERIASKRCRSLDDEPYRLNDRLTAIQNKIDYEKKAAAVLPQTDPFQPVLL